MLLRPSDSGIRLSVGLGGSGKSYGQKVAVFAAARHFPIVAADPCFIDATRRGDWEDLTGLHESVRDAEVRTIDGAKRALADGVGLVVIRPDVYDVDFGGELAGLAMGSPRPMGVVFPECHFVAPSGNRPLHPNMQKLVSAWRHADAAAWFDTQRLSQVHTNVRSAAAGAELRLYAFKGPDDLKAAAELDGQDIVAGVLKCNERYQRARLCCSRGCGDCADDRGWFVTPGIYEPRRG